MATTAQLKALARNAYRGGLETIELDDVTWTVTGHRVRDVTYVVVRAVTGLPVLNFPLNEDEFQREMERRYAVSAANRPEPKSKGGKR